MKLLQIYLIIMNESFVLTFCMSYLLYIPKHRKGEKVARNFKAIHDFNLHKYLQDLNNISYTLYCVCRT